MDKKKLDNPWKGLNFYIEGDVLYGRNVEIQSLSEYIFNNTQTVLYGRSGIGKSSILYAGIFPKARLEGMIPVSIRLNHEEEANYLEQIRAAIEESGLEIKDILAAIPGREQETLWEFMHRHEFYNKEDNKPIIPLLVFDQFEEIFTLQKKEAKKRDFFNQLGHLLNDVKPDYIAEYEKNNRQSQSDVKETEVKSSGAFKGLKLTLNVRSTNDNEQNNLRYLKNPKYHVVFAMREDFLASLELYASNIPVMKDNRFGLLPINEEQAADIIRLPRKGLIEDNVVELIIQHVTGRDDFKLDGKPEIEVDSAILSLYLSRLYEKKSDEEQQITSELVNKSKGHIIRDFYIDSIKSNEEDNEILYESSIFLLEDLLLTHDGRRNNVSRNDLKNKGIRDEELDILIDKRKLLREFNHGNHIRIEYIHDILCPVVKERKDERTLLQQHEEEKRKQEERQRQLLLEEEAKRKEIERKAAEEKKRLEEEARQIKEKNRKRVTFIVSVVLAIALMLFLVWYKDYTENEKLYEEYYAEFENRNGWPVGIGLPLSEDECLRTPLYYKLSHKGNKNGNRHTDVEIMSSAKFLPNTCRLQKLEWAEDMNNDDNARIYNDILTQVKYVRYSAIGGSSEIGKEELLDKDGNLLMTISYFHLSANDAWTQFYTPQGASMPIRNNYLDRAKLSWDSIGRIKSIMYYDAQGISREIVQGNDIKGYLWEYDDKKTYRYALNEYGLPTNGVEHNTIVTYNNDGVVEQTYLNSRKIGDKSAQEVLCRDGYSRSIHRNDSTYFFLPDSMMPYATRYVTKNSLGQITHIYNNGDQSQFASHISYEYTDGLVKKEEFSCKDGTPYGESDAAIYKREFTYNEAGDIIEEKWINKAGELAYQYKVDIKCIDKDTIIFIETLDITQSPSYIMQIDSITPAYTSTTYYGENHVRLNMSIPARHYFIDDVHRKITKTVATSQNRIITNEYYACVNDEIVPLHTDVDNNSGRVMSYFREIVEYDNVGNMLSFKLEDADGTTIKSMMYFIQNGQLIGRAVKGIDGNAVRCNEWEEEGLLYYKLYYSKDFDGNYTAISAVDEWEHKSSLSDSIMYRKSEWYSLKDRFVRVYATRKDAQNDTNLLYKTKVFKRYDQLIFLQDTTISVEIPYIHVLSHKSRMYNNKNGVIDGDRIIALGKWSLGESIDLFKEEWERSMRKGNIHITVLRPEANSYTRREFVLDSDTNESSYIHYHVSMMTPVEREFFNDNFRKLQQQHQK